MWLVSWLIVSLPSSVAAWLAQAAVGAGAVSYAASKVLSFVPMISRYRLPAELVGILLLILGAFAWGAYSADQRMQDRIKEMQQQVAQAEARSREVNTVIQERVVTRIQRVKEVEYVNRDVIREVAGPQLDAVCELPVSSIVLHNSASQNQVASGPGSADGTPSGVKGSTFLETIAGNYAACHENTERLRAWQQWYLEQQRIWEQIN
jgi:roadblock/LC7 domain-containing protein